MTVVKWVGLAVAVVGLVAAGLTGLGQSSYRFGDSETVRCGSVFFPENQDSPLCKELREDSLALLGVALVVVVVGLSGFVVAGRFGRRASAEQAGAVDLDL